jgi:hypothetical protein
MARFCDINLIISAFYVLTLEIFARFCTGQIQCLHLAT